MSEKEKAQQWLQEAKSLEDARTPWEGLWQEQADICHPRRNLVNNRNHSTAAPDSRSAADSLDGTAQRANRTLAYGQASRITPMGARWFGLRPGESSAGDQSAIAWTQRCGEILAQKILGSNFHEMAKEHYLDRGAFGTAATEIRIGRQGQLHFTAFPIGTYAIAENDDNEVDTLCRTYRRTPAQIIQAFPEENIPESVRKKFNDPAARQKPLEIVHYYFPRTDRDPRRSDERNMPVASVHILKEECHILKESGFQEMPVAVSRWERWGEGPWGWAPSTLALPEAGQANFLELMLDTQAEVAAFPRVLYPSGMKGEIAFGPMGLTCFDPSLDKPQEWLSNARYDIGKDRADQKRRAIDEAFFVPLFNAISSIDTGQATATAVNALVYESRELFHPIFANLTREFLGPVIRRSFSIGLRQGWFPPPPPSIIRRDALGAWIDDPAIEYTSAMALALEQSQLSNFGAVVETLAPVAQVDPSVFDFLETDAIGPAFMRYKGLPENFIRPPEAIAAIRQARAEAQQAAMAEQTAGAVQKLGGAKGIQDLAGLAGAP